MKILYSILAVITTTILLAQCPEQPEFNQTYPKRDLRGVFLTSVFNLDWPSSRTATPAVQQAELITILDNLKTNGYNTVFLQVRSECDAMYNSTLEPWSYRLTGTQGTQPTPLWDPLTFAITEAHNRGLDLHAWLNPYRAKANVTEYTSSSNSIVNTQPTWILTPSNAANLRFLNPGLPAVRNYITSIVQDIATRYDVDGIHFDDYFYPNAGMTTNQDNATYTSNNPTNITNISDWRRNNVNTMIANVYDAIQVINTNQNKNIIFGVSPFGIYNTNSPVGITGNYSFSALFCDPLAWLDANKVDYLAPQLYWKITGAQDYVILSKWWNDQVKFRNKQLYISQGYYKMTDANNWAGTEIQNQIIQDRASTMDVTFGQIAYRYIQIKNNDKTINTLLNSAQYQYKSFAPSIAGKDAICPNAPTNSRIEGLFVKWDTPTAALDGDLPVKYVVYAFDNAAQALTNKDDGSKILDIVAGNQLLVDQTILNTKYFVVSALDKNNNENGNFNQPLLDVASYETANLKLSAYPNPFTDQFTLSSVNNLTECEILITDISGKEVFQEKFNVSGNEIVINTLNIKSGFYFGNVRFKNGNIQTFKIIKK